MSDAFGIREGNLIRIGTAGLEKVLEWTGDGALRVKSLKHLATGKEYAQPGCPPSDEFFATIDTAPWRGSDGGYDLTGVENRTLSQGELETVVSLSRDGIAIRRHYVAYPGLAVIQEWTEYENRSGRARTISRPSLFVQRLLAADRDRLDFAYMTGGGNFSGSQIMKTVPLADGFVKQFDSQGQPEIIEVDGRKGNTWHPRLNGCAVWNEFFALSLPGEREGLFRTFDYQGWWKATMSNCDGAPVLNGHCELIDYALPEGETLRIAPSTIGFYSGDKDDLGNAIGEYIYRYKWDYTREKYFNRTNLTIWRCAPLTEKVFKLAEAARYCGYERVWVDDFWFDAKGNWNGIFGDDWAEINRYLKRSGLLFRLWMPPWHADRLSQVALEHPEWMLDFHGNWYNWTIDMSREEAYQWVLEMLCRKQREFGVYDLRVDGDPCNLWNDGSFDTDNQGNWNGTLKQSENFYRLYREFKDKNPDAGLDGCSSGGHTLGIESARYTDQQQITDGWCFHMGGYDTTMILPIDKHQGMPIYGETRPNWHRYGEQDLYLFSAPGDLMQNPEDGWTIEALEGRRKDLELFYFLRMQGVYGRYIKVYRPEAALSNKTFLLQRMTWDNHKGLLMISANPLNPLLGKTDRVYLKGLNPSETYLIESRLGSMAPERKTGEEWMRDGVELRNVRAGEYLFINLPNRPGTGSIQQPPQPPREVEAARCRWLAHDGTGVSWQPPEDGRLISYYEIARDGAPFTKVATGTYCFDTTAEAGAAYQVRSVDFDGNASPWVDAR